MNAPDFMRLALASALAAMALPALAQNAARGATLYAALPGQAGVGSCISCHGDPINNRNSVLRGAAGAALISKTITAVSAMGYLRQHLADTDLADIAAYLGTVVPAGAVDELPAPWPTGDDFGAHQVGTQAPQRMLLIRNLQPRGDIAIAAVLSTDPAVFPVQHDCPLSLPPLGQCRVRAWFNPQALGPAEARFNIVDTNGRLLRSGSLRGTGTATQPPGLSWGAAPELLDFDRVTVGQSAQRMLRLENRSAQPVLLQGLRVTGPNAARFTLRALCATAARLEAGASCDVVVEHVPAAAERSEGWIEVTSNSSNAPLVRITAIGVAATAPEPAPPVATPAAGAGGGGSDGWVALLVLAVAVLWRGRRGSNATAGPDNPS